MKKAVVLFSGGIDSTVTLTLARNEYFEVYAISFNYGQRHNIELTLAKQSAVCLGVKKHLVFEINLGDIGGSALTSDIEVPKNRESLSVKREATKERPLTPDNSPLTDIPVTYVPARNTIFLSFALAFAESIGTGDIFIGANAIDYSGYPDCRPEFIDAFEKMANLATRASVEGSIKFNIHAPLINLTKKEIIRKGEEVGVDFSLTWSCYDPQPVSSKYDVVPCQRCDSCLLRAKGFAEAGINDPWKLKATS